MTTNEEDLARKLGVPRSVLKGWRKDMVKGSDWMLETGRVVFTAGGIRKLEEKLGLRQIPDGFYFTDKEYKRVRVKRNWPHNKRIVTCIDDGGAELDVRVRNNENFRSFMTNGKPMELTVRKDGDGWTLEGRGPRYVGRW